MAFAAALNRLRSQHPEWAPWLAVVQHTVSGEETSVWDSSVPTRPTRRAATPLLANAALDLPADRVDRLIRGTIATAAEGATPAMGSLASLTSSPFDALALFHASLCRNDSWIAQLAETSGVDADALHAVAALVPVPFLLACGRVWAAEQPDAWVESYCPLCGGWPTLTEVRGIERSRHHRCGRCGSAWHARLLTCPFCGTLDHDRLVSLVPEKGGPGTIDACQQCRGYVKTFTRLQGSPPDEVMLEDLATVDLDLAAVEQGFSRPAGLGCTLAVDIAGDRHVPATQP